MLKILTFFYPIWILNIINYILLIDVFYIASDFVFYKEETQRDQYVEHDYYDYSYYDSDYYEKTTTTIVDSTITIELNPLKLKQEHSQLLELLQNLEKKDALLRGKRRKNLLFMRHLHGIIYN